MLAGVAGEKKEKRIFFYGHRCFLMWLEKKKKKGFFLWTWMLAGVAELVSGGMKACGRGRTV